MLLGLVLVHMPLIMLAAWTFAVRRQWLAHQQQCSPCSSMRKPSSGHVSLSCLCVLQNVLILATKQRIDKESITPKMDVCTELVITDSEATCFSALQHADANELLLT